MVTQNLRQYSSRWLLVSLMIAGLVPFFCSLVAHAVGATDQKPTPREQPPALVFDQYLITLGKVLPVPVIPGYFRFTNRSDRTVTVTDLKPSCGCLNPRLEKRVYQPNESGEFSVRVETASENSGQKEFYVNFFYQDPEPREVVLTFKFILPEEKIAIRPRALIFYQFSDRPTTQEIVITDSRERPAHIIGLECRSPLVKAAMVNPGEDSAGYHETRVTVTVTADVPPGRHQTLLMLKTDDAEFPVLKVPLMIFGPDAAAPQTATGRDQDNSEQR